MISNASLKGKKAEGKNKSFQSVFFFLLLACQRSSSEVARQTPLFPGWLRRNCGNI